MLNVKCGITQYLLVIGTVLASFTVCGDEVTRGNNATLKVGFMSSIKRIDDGQYVGALPDIIRQTAALANYDLSLQAMPIKRLLKSLESGQVDVVIGLFKRDDREVYSDYLDRPIGWVCANMFILKSNRDIDHRPESLSYKNIGLLRGASWGSELNNVLKKQKAYQTHVSNYEMLAKMLHKGRFDAVIASSDAFHSAARKQDLDQDYIALPLPYANSLAMYILVSKKSKLAKRQPLKVQLNDALEILTNNQSIRQIYRSHGKVFDEHCKQ